MKKTRTKRANLLIRMEYKVKIFNLTRDEDIAGFEQTLYEFQPTVIDTIESQVKELLLSRNCSLQSKDVDNLDLVSKFLNNFGDRKEAGVWVFYPWSNKVLHLLNEEDFVEVRTNRNKLKISTDEQITLGTKKVGIAGLSVGRSIALTLALERTAGELHLADFDTLDLSNLNRIKAPLHQLGLNKAVATAREIAEIDPFIKVTCFKDGLTEENMKRFFLENGKLNIFIEECDDIAIKINARLKAREFGIPVIMETSDNCIVDIERFDLEPKRPIFHGRLTEKEIEIGRMAKTMDEKLFVLSKILNPSNVSSGMKKSLQEMGKSIRSWPQLGSEVVRGGGVNTHFTRKILLNQHSESGQTCHKLAD